MDIKKRKLKGYVALSILLILCLIMASAMTFIAPNNANAFTSSTTVASQSTNLGELMLDGYENSEDGKVFNSDVFWKLVRLVTGDSKANKSTLKNWSGTRTASQFRTSNADNGSKDLTITINGTSWTPVYLSTNEITVDGVKVQQPILTFWLSSSTITDKWHTQASNNIGTYPNNMYGTSYMRASILNNGGKYATAYNASSLTSVTQSSTGTWAIYTVDKSKNSKSIKEYLEVPDNMSWQHNQSAKTSAGQSYDFNNDALDSGCSYNSTRNYYTNTSVSTSGYQAWKNDTLWLPSVAEVGAGTSVAGLWRTSQNQRASATSTSHCWLRSGSEDGYRGSYYIKYDGSAVSHNYVSTSSYVIRPAFHLNLSSVGDAVGVSEPTDVEVDYNGEKQSIEKLIENGADIKWFDEDLMTMDYPSANQYDMIDADTYSVKVTLNDKNDKFAGTPDKSIGEDDQTRYFDFKINTKKIKGTLTKNGTIVTFTLDDGQIYTDVDTEANGRAPTFAINYKNKSGTASYESTTPPSDAGNYTATVIISNPETCKNYELDKTYSTDITIDKKSVTKPSLSSNASLYYTGQEQEIELSNVSSDVTITPPANSGMEYDADKKVLKVTNAGTYNVTLKLNNAETTKWSDGDSRAEVTLPVVIGKAELIISFISPEGEWTWNAGVDKTVTIKDDRKNDEDVIEYVAKVDGKDIAFDKITSIGEKKTNITIPKQSTRTEKYTFSISLGNATDDNQNRNYEISTSTTSEKKFSITDKEVEIKEEYIIWSYSNDGKITTLESWNSKTTYDKVSYNGKEFSFSAKLDEEIYNDESINISLEDGITISKTETKKSGVVVTASKNAGEYTTTITITSSKVKFKVGNETKDSVTFTLTWKINKAKFNLSDVSWNYDPNKEGYPFEYDTGLKTVVLQNLPAGLAIADYEDDGNANVDGNKASKVCAYNESTKEYTPYKTTVKFKYDTSVEDVANNYYLPTSTDRNSYTYKVDEEDAEFPFELKWIIKKGVLDLDAEWERYPFEDSSSRVFRPYRVASKTVEAKIQYKYYEEKDYDQTNGIATGAPVELKDIVVDLNNPKKYYVVAEVNDKYASNYEIKQGTQAKRFNVGANVVINIDMDTEFIYDGKAHGVESEWKFDEDAVETEHIVGKWYSIEKVKGENGEEEEVKTLLEEAPKKAGTYLVAFDFDDENHQDSYALSVYNVRFEIKQAELVIALDGNKTEFEFNGEDLALKLNLSCDNKLDVSGVKIVKTYYEGTEIKEDGSNKLDGVLPKNVGKYIVVLSIDETDEDNYRNYYIKDTCIKFDIEITPYQITAEWDTTGDIPTLKGLTSEEKEKIEYVYTDSEGNVIEDISAVEAGNYKVIARIKSEYAGNYVFVDGDGQVLENVNSTEQAFEIEAQEPENPEDPIVPVDPTTPEDPTEPTPTPSIDIVQIIKEYWQPILSAICIILIIIFMSKGIGYAGKRKKIKKTIEKKYSNAYYAVGGVGLFNLPYTTWTIIACILAGVTVLAFIFMLLEKKSLSKVEEELDDARSEYEQAKEKKKEDEMRMMLMGMMGGNANGGQGFAFQQGVSADEMRLMLNDAVTAMLPNVTQYLPQEASHSDELIQQLIEQNAQSEERMRQMNEQNEERIEKLVKQLAEQNKSGVDADAIERLVDKLSKQQVVEKQAEREVAATNVNDEKIEMLIRNQEMLMRQMMELSSRNNDKQIIMPYPQPVVQQPIMPQPTIIQQPAEKIIIEKPVEKIVEKEVRVEVPVEKIVPVPMPVEKPAKATKAPAQRLTLDEAYAKLSANQKKIFDTLKAYAMSKDKCKEKKSTYFTILGQSTVNPLVKLTIKKNTTVALFKMEDEYMKDIRRGASSDGTKVKVKETEVVVGDNQALSTAKDMIDLREDQIERYNDYLKEQRSMKKK
ncbi:MAG: hypothetical protein HDT32_07425 [Clostridiales bacterium]|nr:hypothetical protein [Clostridiales bacterium]